MLASVLLLSYGTAPFKEVQPSNMREADVTLLIFHKSDTYIVTKLLEFKNILPILVTFEVSKLDKSNTLREVNPANVSYKEETLLVSKLDKLILVRDLHLLNI